MSDKIAVLGSGAVGITLANGFEQLGNSVVLANRSGHDVEGWSGKVSTYTAASKIADIVVLAVKGLVAEEVIQQTKANVKNKIVIDTTNPIAGTPPENGVIKYFTSLDESLMERLQTIAPDANFVKAFSSVGNAFMVNPKFKDTKPTMFICGNSPEAKDKVTRILDNFGWETQDVGGVKSARAIEPLCILWCLPGFTHNQWNHAFKLLKT